MGPLGTQYRHGLPREAAAGVPSRQREVGHEGTTGTRHRMQNSTHGQRRDLQRSKDSCMGPMCWLGLWSPEEPVSGFGGPETATDDDFDELQQNGTVLGRRHPGTLFICKAATEKWFM